MNLWYLSYGFGIEIRLAAMTMKNSMDRLLPALSRRKPDRERNPEKESRCARNRYHVGIRRDGRRVLAILAERPTRMLPPTGDAVPPDRAALAYDEHFDLLRFIAARKFGVPEAEVENLVHEVFLAYLRYVSQIRDDRSWLVAAVCNASRAYWRGMSRSPLPVAALESGYTETEISASRLDARTILARLPVRCQELLRLRFFDGYSPKELAARYRTTVAYAKVRLHRCMKAARGLLHGAR